MTRLQAGDLLGISGYLADYDEELLKKTGLTLKGLAARAAGLSEAAAGEIIKGQKAAIVPMTCGQGLIPGFTETVRDIALHLGLAAAVTEATDAAGLAEAFEARADIVLAADDHCFAAFNLNTKRVVDNGEATGRGFVQALEQMAGGLTGRRVLVIGGGSVGRSAGLALLELGAEVAVYDINPGPVERWVAGIVRGRDSTLLIVDDLGKAVREHRYILESSPAPDVLDEAALSPATYIAAPGVPCGVSRSAREKHAARIIHDPLRIGTATMLLLALR
ncbi:MAG: 3-methylornithyl-N6-L-lysine dehydrogenase PylD [Thermodesulfobacteriota bacterium]